MRSSSVLPGLIRSERIDTGAWKKEEKEEKAFSFFVTWRAAHRAFFLVHAFKYMSPDSGEFVLSPRFESGRTSPRFEVGRTVSTVYIIS